MRPYGHLAVLSLGCLAAYAGQQALFLVSWWGLAAALLEGHLDAHAGLIWLLAQAGSLGCRLVATRLQGELVVSIGARVRQRLLHGTLSRPIEKVHREGTGRLLGRVLEAETIEDTVAGGGLAGLAAIVELAVAAVLLTVTGGPSHLVLLLGWLGITATIATFYGSARARWTEQRLSLGEDLTEKLAGHRTRVAQQPSQRWHDGEALALSLNDQRGRSMDRALVALTVLPRAWAVVGIAAVALGGRGGTDDPAHLAASVVVVLLTAGVLARVNAGAVAIADGVAAWRQVVPLLAASPHSPTDPAVVTVPPWPVNHLFAGPLAMNLLLGRRWPATERDLAEAREVCVAIGLGPLLDRMPGGLGQMVGETGWRLSQGERGLVFLARGILQAPGGTLVVDDPFSALDPPGATAALAATRSRVLRLHDLSSPRG